MYLLLHYNLDFHIDLCSVNSLSVVGEPAVVSVATTRCHGDEGGHRWKAAGHHVPQNIHPEA